MVVTKTEIEGLLIIQPKVFSDDRGFFVETYQKERYESFGIPGDFVQDNMSKSSYGVLRGLHIQTKNMQGKLVQVIEGEVFDVAVDLRFESPTYGKWEGVTLSSKLKNQFWIPEGFAHGFITLSETAILSYKCTNYYNPKKELTVLWNDPDININWPISPIVMADKDLNGIKLSDFLPNKIMVNVNI